MEAQLSEFKQIVADLTLENKAIDPADHNRSFRQPESVKRWITWLAKKSFPSREPVITDICGKKVWRVYKDMRLNLPRRTKRRLPKRPKQSLVAPTEKNITWALDFMHDTLYYGKPFRTLSIIDESNREILAIEIDTSLPAGRVIRTLEQLGEIYGLPQAIRLDNGPELRSAVMTEWCEDKGIELRYIQPGKPDLPPINRAIGKLVKSDIKGVVGHEEAVYG